MCKCINGLVIILFFSLVSFDISASSDLDTLKRYWKAEQALYSVLKNSIIDLKDTVYNLFVSKEPIKVVAEKDDLSELENISCVDRSMINYFDIIDNGIKSFIDKKQLLTIDEGKRIVIIYSTFLKCFNGLSPLDHNLFKRVQKLTNFVLRNGNLSVKQKSEIINLQSEVNQKYKIVIPVEPKIRSVSSSSTRSSMIVDD